MQVLVHLHTWAPMLESLRWKADARPESSLIWNWKLVLGSVKRTTCKMLLWCDRETKSSEVAKGRMVSGNPGHEPLIWCVVARSTAISSIYWSPSTPVSFSRAAESIIASIKTFHNTHEYQISLLCGPRFRLRRRGGPFQMYDIYCGIDGVGLACHEVAVVLGGLKPGWAMSPVFVNRLYEYSIHDNQTFPTIRWATSHTQGAILLIPSV